MASELGTVPVPRDCASWKFGPDEAASPGASRSASDVWCGVALFADFERANAALDHPHAHVPRLAEASEAWHALLRPTMHHGECNLVDPAQPGRLFEAREADPGGALFVMTTAGFNLRARSDFARLIDFRRRVNRMRSVMAEALGSIAHQVFAPADPGDDAVTLSLWRDDASMARFAYLPGSHRNEVDRQRSDRTVDRSSFTRFRVVRSIGQWHGKSLP